MTSIVQNTVILNSQNRLRGADSRAREWVVAHAGAYQSQARKELGGSDVFREWSNENLTLRVAKLTTDGYKQVQICGASYELSDGSEPYSAYVVTYTPADAEQAGGYCMTVAVIPDALDDADVPWGDTAGPVGMDRFIEAINSDRSRPAVSGDGAAEVASIDDLFSIYNNAVVLTDEAGDDFNIDDLEEQHGGWATVVGIGASEQRALARELPDDQLREWIESKIALFARYADADGKRLRMTETDPERAEIMLMEERDRVSGDVAGRNVVALLKMMESVAAIAPKPSSAEPDGEVGASDESSAADSVATQQRINTLEDQLKEAEGKIAELQERIAEYETFEYEEEEVEEEADERKPESIADSNRHAAVLEAITDPVKFPRLRFLSNCEKALADYGKPRPSGMEIVGALDAINRLAQAWHYTPNGNIGPWSNYFIELPGWKYADGESEMTMGKFGTKRSFSDQEKARHVEITRHLTYQGSSGGLQIYFDRDEGGDSFIVGYIGEHLPYFTSPS